MRYLIIVAAILAAGTASAGDRAQCLRDSAPRTINVTTPAGGIANNVMCCCPTSNGGQCCKYVSFCGGFIPGCFCSMRGADRPREVWSKPDAG
jgi:hypothetical protein